MEVSIKKIDLGLIEPNTCPGLQIINSSYCRPIIHIILVVSPTQNSLFSRYFNGKIKMGHPVYTNVIMLQNDKLTLI